MRNDEIQISEWGVDEHPATELLRQYEEGILPAALNYELERHLLDCEMCEDVLSGMALADRSRTRQARERIWQRLRTRLRKNRRRVTVLHILTDWRVAVAVLMTFCSLGLILFYHYTQTLERQQTFVYPAGIQPPSPEELLARTIDSAIVLEIQAPPPTPVQPLPASKRMRPAGQAEQMIHGRLLSTEGQGIANAQVWVKATSKRASTDPDGNFSVAATGRQQVLVFSAAGFQAQELTVSSSSSPLTVRLKRTSE